MDRVWVDESGRLCKLDPPPHNFMASTHDRPVAAVRWLRAVAARLQAERDLRVALSDLAALDAELDHRPDAAAGGDAWLRRTQLVWEVYHLAVTACWQASVDVDPELPAYPVVVRIELPAGSIGLVAVSSGTMPAPGQLSWHVVAGLRPPQHRMRWDGHTREEQAARIAAYLDTTEPGT